jgi:hypothetical protein
LRQAQLRALETYWYLRLVEGTPHVFELYQRYYARPLDLLAALGLDRDEIKDFISPTIVERLGMDTPLFKAQIPDWRAMVDIVAVKIIDMLGEEVLVTAQV